MSKDKKPPPTALVKTTGGPPDAVLVLWMSRWRHRLAVPQPFVVCAMKDGANGKELQLVYEKPVRVDLKASYLVAEALTYEIVGIIRDNVYILAEGKQLIEGRRYLLVPMGRDAPPTPRSQ